MHQLCCYIQLMANTTRRELDRDEIDDAKRLAEVFRQRKAELKAQGIRMTQESLAHDCGWRGQSAVSQYVNARIPLNLDALVKLSAALGVAPERISPRLAARLTRPASNLDVVEPAGIMEGPPTAGEIDVPYFREVELAAGNGACEVIENHGVTKRLPLRALEQSGVAVENAACATVRGDSMLPVLPDGTCIGIDRGTTDIVDGEIYAIDHDGMLRVKYLYRMPLGRVRIASENDSEYPDEIVSGDDLQFLRIIGRVFWFEVIRPRR